MPADFVWTRASELAAKLTADGDLYSTEIASAVGVARSTLYVWREHPAFADRIEEHRAAIRAEVASLAISHRPHRVRALQETWRRLRQIMEERAADPEMQAIPGGSTGLVVRTAKAFGKGEDFQLVWMHEVDVALSREIRETMKQAAIELGQWQERHELAHDVASMSDSELVREAGSILGGLTPFKGADGE